MSHAPRAGGVTRGMRKVGGGGRGGRRTGAAAALELPPERSAQLAPLPTFSQARPQAQPRGGPTRCDARRVVTQTSVPARRARPPPPHRPSASAPGVSAHLTLSRRIRRFRTRAAPGPPGSRARARARTSKAPPGCRPAAQGRLSALQPAQLTDRVQRKARRLGRCAHRHGSRVTGHESATSPRPGAAQGGPANEAKGAERNGTGAGGGERRGARRAGGEQCEGPRPRGGGKGAPVPTPRTCFKPPESCVLIHSRVERECMTTREPMPPGTISKSSCGQLAKLSVATNGRPAALSTWPPRAETVQMPPTRLHPSFMSTANGCNGP